MIYFTGDTHGEISRFKTLLEERPEFYAKKELKEMPKNWTEVLFSSKLY